MIVTLIVESEVMGVDGGDKEWPIEKFTGLLKIYKIQLLRLKFLSFSRR